MLPRRIYLNLAAFAVLFALLSAWAVQNVLRPDLLRETYRVDADFADATGLRTGVEVTLRGVRVGRVASVTLRAGEADVAMDIDGTVPLPDGAAASVRRRSAVGEPYVAIEAPSGWRDGDRAMATDGYRIPIAATSAPLAYGELFAAADSLLAAVDPDDLGTVTRELAIALGGRGDTLARLVDSGSDAVSTLATGEAELRALGEGLTALAHTLAERSGTIADATADLGDIVETVATNTDDIEALLEESPVLADRINVILASSYAQMVCGADAAAAISTAIGSEQTVADIVRLLQAAETASVVIPQAIYQGPDGRYLSGTFGFAPGELNEYDTFEAFQTPPSLPTCTGAAPAPNPPTSASAVDDGSTAATPDTLTPTESPDGGDAASATSGTTPPRDDDTSFLVALAAGILAVAIGVASLAALRGRFAAARDRQPEESIR